MRDMMDNVRASLRWVSDGQNQPVGRQEMHRRLGTIRREGKVRKVTTQVTNTQNAEVDLSDRPQHVEIGEFECHLHAVLPDKYE